MTARANLDRFYTKPEVARECWNVFAHAAGELGMDLRAYWFVEPSAGYGCFYRLLPPQRRIGIDIAPAINNDDGKTFAATVSKKHGGNNGIMRADYLTWLPPHARARNYAVIGNPPFGKRGKLARDFFNHSAFADVIALVLPAPFKKYATHRRLPPQYALIAREQLARDSFYTPDGKDFAVNAEFQIWTSLPTRMKNLRATTPPPTAHPDFQMRQYNNTAQTLKVFAQPFDFAVPCQGYQDYARRETNAASCEKHKQWMLFSAANIATRKRLMRMDFAKLAWESATAVPGFRKNDVVRVYLAEAK